MCNSAWFWMGAGAFVAVIVLESIDAATRFLRRRRSIVHIPPVTHEQAEKLQAQWAVDTLRVLGFTVTNEDVPRLYSAIRDLVSAIEWIRKHGCVVSRDRDGQPICGRKCGCIPQPPGAFWRFLAASVERPGLLRCIAEYSYAQAHAAADKPEPKLPEPMLPEATDDQYVEVVGPFDGTRVDAAFASLRAENAALRAGLEWMRDDGVNVSPNYVYLNGLQPRAEFYTNLAAAAGHPALAQLGADGAETNKAGSEQS